MSARTAGRNCAVPAPQRQGMVTFSERMPSYDRTVAKMGRRCRGLRHRALGAGAAGQRTTRRQSAPRGQFKLGPESAVAGLAQDPDDLRARIERLERQNEELMQALRNANSHVSTDGAPAGPSNVNKDDVQRIVKDYLAERDADKKQPAANSAESPEGYKVGSVLGVTAAFNEWGNLWITTPNKDFTMHPGYWVQWDNVFWDQSPP